MALLHRVGLEAYLLPYRLGIRKRYRLNVPIIAIGNLSSGGTGKTPMTVLVARHLQSMGQRVVVLSRGHGGTGENRSLPRVVSDGNAVLLTPSEAGDEPVLLANLLPGIPVVVCRDRRKSGRFAVETFAPEIIVCDDALQYWQLHRDLDIVLLDARRPFDNGYVLPRGLLREPPSHLARAGIAVLTRADRLSPGGLETTLTTVRKFAPTAALFTAIHAPIAWVTREGSVFPLPELAQRPVLAFSGIADGRAFVESVRERGADVRQSRDFGDHYAYDAGDIARLVKMAQTAECTAVVTTEKDLVKVAPLWSEDAPPLYALRIGMTVNDEPGFFERLNTLSSLSCV
jgi:tetraacyldisaccharide 4'-kinase